MWVNQPGPGTDLSTDRNGVGQGIYAADGGYSAAFCWTIGMAGILNASPLRNVFLRH